MFEGERLPDLGETGMPYLVPEWTWVVCEDDKPFAIFITSFAHGWLVFWRVLSNKPPSVSSNWFLEAVPRILENAQRRGCVGVLTMLADNKKAETKLARIIARRNGKLVPFCGCLGVMPFKGVA
jgi:hypothetical protein